MDSLAQSLRLVLGLGMVAAGSALAAPAGLHLAALVAQHTAPKQAMPAADSSWAVDAAPWPPVAADVPFHALHPSAGRQLEYVPPPVPPEPMPQQSLTLTEAGPQLAAGYRPTLQTPPPPLLDGQAPPPLAVGWTARQPDGWAGSGVSQGPQYRAEQASIYIVRDGDDLTGIATRFYGHPAAATAIWQANRGLLRDPGLLPIGAALVLPPSSAVAALGRPADPSAIEPVALGGRQATPVHEVISRPASWLTENGGSTGPLSPLP